MNLVIGDLVRLASGGPIMVVENPKADGGVVCTWFDRAGAKHTHTFAMVALKYATPEPSVTLRLMNFLRQVGAAVNRARRVSPAVVGSSRPEQHALSLGNTGMNFLVGDVVRLTSGGPIMIVENPKADGGVVCTWFDRAGAKQAQTFATEALTYGTPEAAPRVMTFLRRVRAAVNKS